jgi:YggT family protein
MGGSAGNLIVGLLDLIITIYIILLFIRMFLTDYERYDAVLDMVFQATDPIVVPLATSLRSRNVQLVPLLIIVVLLLVKGMLAGSIPEALQDFLSTLLKIYVLTIIVTAAFREAYLNPSHLGRACPPGRRLVAFRIAASHGRQCKFGRDSRASHTLAVPYHNMAGGADDLLLVKSAFIYSLRLIVNLTWFFVLVLFLYVILSWFSPDPRNPLVQLLTLIAIPILEPVRRLIPPIGGVIDLSPILAMFALQLLNAFLHSILNAL